MTIHVFDRSIGDEIYRPPLGSRSHPTIPLAVGVNSGKLPVADAIDCTFAVPRRQGGQYPRSHRHDRSRQVHFASLFLDNSELHGVGVFPCRSKAHDGVGNGNDRPDSRDRPGVARPAFACNLDRRLGQINVVHLVPIQGFGFYRSPHPLDKKTARRW